MGCHLLSWPLHDRHDEGRRNRSRRRCRRASYASRKGSQRPRQRLWRQPPGVAREGAEAGGFALEILHVRRRFRSGLLLEGLRAAKLVQRQVGGPKHGRGQVRSLRPLRVLVQPERLRLRKDAGERGWSAGTQAGMVGIGAWDRCKYRAHTTNTARARAASTISSRPFRTRTNTTPYGTEASASG